MNRTDRFEAWWQEQQADWDGLNPEMRAMVWALCREAWYTSRRQTLEER